MSSGSLLDAMRPCGCFVVADAGLAEFSDDADRYAKARKNYASTSPTTR